MTVSRRRGPGATNMELAGARFVAGCWKFKVEYRKFTQERRQALLLVEYGFLKVRLPSHSDRIADITEGPSSRHKRTFPTER